MNELDDLLALALPDIVDTDSTHLDVVVQEEVEKTEEPVQTIVGGTCWERVVRHWRRGGLALDVFG